MSLEIIRDFAAPKEAVFGAWVTPEAFASWFGGPGTHVPVDTVEIDVRVGGTWIATMTFDERDDIHWRGEYLEVEPSDRLVFTITDEPGESREICTVLLTESGTGTRMVFTQAGSGLTPEGYEQARAGWMIFFEQLAKIVEQ
jgi:uncharacterized protein YndB with AHSA1/START domain